MALKIDNLLLNVIFELSKYFIHCIDTKNTPTSEAAHVSIQTSTYGINTGGTVYRMDDVPISLRPAFDSPFPSDLEVLTKLREKVNKLAKKLNRPYATKKYI